MDDFQTPVKGVLYSAVLSDLKEAVTLLTTIIMASPEYGEVTSELQHAARDIRRSLFSAGTAACMPSMDVPLTWALGTLIDQADELATGMEDGRYDEGGETTAVGLRYLVEAVIGRIERQGKPVAS